MRFSMLMLLPAVFVEFEKKHSECRSPNCSQLTSSNSYGVTEMYLKSKPLSSYHFSLSSFQVSQTGVQQTRSGIGI